MRSKKPNILIIMIDSMRADHVSCYGYEKKTTPNIDRLAAEGCVFENAFTAAPFSPASYASLFSNMYTSEHGVNGDTVRVWPDGFERLHEKLGKVGYSTFGISTNAFVGRATRCDRGFDIFHELFVRSWFMRKYSGVVRRARKVFPEGITQWLEPHHVRWPEMRRSGTAVHLAAKCVDALPHPFFGFVILMDPHAPYDRGRRTFRSGGRETRAFLADINNGQMWAKLMANHGGLTEEQLRVALNFYDSEIHHADACVGWLCDALRQRGILDNTVVVVAADHGEAFGEHGVWGHGFCLNDCLTHVPLIVRLPDVWKGSTRSKALVQLHDIHQTCCTLAGVPSQRTDSPGVCLTEGANAAWSGRPVALSEFPVQTGALALFRKLNPEFEPGVWGAGMVSARSDRWRLVQYGNGEEVLYDVGDCSRQEVEIGQPDSQIVSSLRDALTPLSVDARAASGDAAADSGDTASTDAVMERLRDLGYTN